MTPVDIQASLIAYNSDNDRWKVEKYLIKSTGYKDYTTTDTETDVLSIDADAFERLTIMIKNTGDTNSADVVVYSMALDGGQIRYVEYSGTLAPGDVVKVQLNGAYDKVIVSAKSTNSGAFTTIRIEWIGIH